MKHFRDAVRASHSGNFPAYLASWLLSSAPFLFCWGPLHSVRISAGNNGDRSGQMANVSWHASERKALSTITLNLFGDPQDWTCTFSAPVWGVQELMSPLILAGYDRACTKDLGSQVSPPHPEAVGACGRGGWLNWKGMVFLCSTSRTATNECCCEQHQGYLPGVRSVQVMTASLVGAQAEVAQIGQDHAAVTVGTLEQSILLLSEWALLPHCPLFLIIYMLECAFFILPITHTHVFLFSGLLCAFSRGFLVTRECSFPCALTLICMFSVWQLPTLHYWALQLFNSRQSNPSAQLHLLALLRDWAATWTTGRVWVCTSPLPGCAEAFFLFVHPAICIVRTEPQAPVKMVTLTIHCLQDKLGIL